MSGPGRGTAGHTGVRAVALARCGWGAACLLRPAGVLSAAGGHPGEQAARVVTRVLGARELVQAVATIAAPLPTVTLAGAVVDALHAASALGLAAVDPQRRRPALINALTAGFWLVLGLLLLRTRRERFSG